MPGTTPDSKKLRNLYADVLEAFAEDLKPFVEALRNDAEPLELWPAAKLVFEGGSLSVHTAVLESWLVTITKEEGYSISDVEAQSEELDRRYKGLEETSRIIAVTEGVEEDPELCAVMEKFFPQLEEEPLEIPQDILNLLQEMGVELPQEGGVGEPDFTA